LLRKESLVWHSFRPYVPVARRKAQAVREVEKRKKKGEVITPVVIEGRNIAHTFWGKAWCENLESYSDFANRLPRGRTYVRNGSVVDLQIHKGKITALVSGSSLYKITVQIGPLLKNHWSAIKTRCSGEIGSLVELLQGRLSKGVMDVVTAHGSGLFPKPAEIKLACSCPDWAGMCKHVAAVLYGVGARLDTKPELLFLLRQVDHLELIAEAVPQATNKQPRGKNTLAASDLAGVFGIELAEPGAAENAKPAKTKAAMPKQRASRAAAADGNSKNRKAAPSAKAVNPVPKAKNAVRRQLGKKKVKAAV
jgi:uncharacterized Zn finger protein